MGPDYIYTLNLLYSMGIRARVDFIRLEEQLRCKSVEDAIAGYAWMFRDLDTEEQKRLEAYVHSLAVRDTDGELRLHRPHVPVWAFISWFLKE